MRIDEVFLQASAMNRTFLRLLLFWVLFALELGSAITLPPGEEGTAVPVRVGDLVNIVMTEDPEVAFHGEVDASGYITLPYIREFRIIGLTEESCAAALREKFTVDLYQQATLSVRIVRRAPGEVYVYGAVKTPGAVSLPQLGQLTILQAISRVNGITAWASPDRCVVTRFHPVTGNRDELPVNLVSAFREIGGPEDLKLLSDDVIFVPAANAELSQFLSNEAFEVIVVGQVNSPGIVSFAPGETRTFMRALFKAGNFTRFAKKKAVRVISYGEDKKREVRTVDAELIIDDGFLEFDFELQPGDMIIVDEKIINF